MTLAVILLCLGFCLVVMEVFIPSGGALTLLAILSMVISVYFAFAESTLAGALFLAAAIIGMPLLAYELLKVFPRTAAGRRFMLFGPKGHEEVATSSELKLREFQGKRGVAKSKLRPSGVAEIDGQRVDVVSEGMIIESGTPIEVVDISGNRIVVRELQDSSGQDEEHGT
jgi:membrane-bound serine protease (ClpP class)